jgi:pseudomonalisin
VKKTSSPCSAILLMRLHIVATTLLGLGMLVGNAARAASPDLVVAAVDSAKRAALPTSHVSWARAQNDVGRVPDNIALEHLSVVLQRTAQRQQAYDRLLQDQQDPSSPSYHQWLSPTAIGKRFGASQHDIDALSAWLNGQGLQVGAIANNRTRITFSGSAANVAATFGTELHYFQAGSEQRIANTDTPTIPAALAGAVRSVIGLSKVTFKPAHRMGAPRQSAYRKDAPHTAGTYCANGPCSYTVFPTDFATIYDLGPVQQQGIDGTGQTIAIVGLQRVYNPDIQNFQTLSGLATKYPTVIVPPAGIDPGPPASTCSQTGTPSCSKPNDAVGNQGEATLDVQRAASVAPGATIDLIVSSMVGQEDGTEIAMDYVIDTDPVPAHILNISFTSCEAQNSQAVADSLDEEFSQAQMEGISVFVASGDAGVAGCADITSPPAQGVQADAQASPNILCSSSHVTCVGGTEFTDTSDPGMYWAPSNGSNYESALGYIPEGAWNEPLDGEGNPQYAASGGDVSSYIATPAWQVGTGVPGTQGRYTPDMAFGASTRDAYFSCLAAQGGSCAISNGGFTFIPAGGTSASAPSMAGVAALLNQKIGAPQANLNPRLYALAANPANNVFHDVTVASSGVTDCTLATPSPCNNSTPGTNGLTGGLPGYMVGTGYDPVTGLGSIDVANLLAQWSNPNAAAVNLDQHGLSGSWYNPATSGQGIVMEVDQDFYAAGTGLLFAGWYTYDTSAAGGQRWYTIQGQVDSSNTSASLPINLSQGGRFVSPLAVTTTPVGQAIFQFSDCTHGSLQYSFSDGSGRHGTIPLTRLDANVTCGQTGDNGSAASSFLLSGAWDESSESGQGFVFDINPIQNILFAGWYTYAINAGPGSGPAGQHWYTLQGTLIPGTTTVSSIGIYDTTGGVFDQGTPTSTNQVGTATLVYQSCTSATLAYTFFSGFFAGNEGQTGTLNLSRLGKVPSGCHL